jgi:anti-anti-sigma factor
VNDLAELAIVRDGGVLLASLSGEVDLSNASDIERTIMDAVPNTAFGMLLDLSDVTYIDSAGVRLLLALADRFRWRAQELGLVVPEDSRIRRVLTMAGAEGALVLDTTTDAARARMHLPGPAP